MKDHKGRFNKSMKNWRLTWGRGDVARQGDVFVVVVFFVNFLSYFRVGEICSSD